MLLRIKPPIRKLVSIATDEGKAMVGGLIGFIALLQKNNDFSDSLK